MVGDAYNLDISKERYLEIIRSVSNEARGDERRALGVAQTAAEASGSRSPSANAGEAGA